MRDEISPPEWDKALQEESAKTVFQLILKLMRGSATWAKHQLQWQQAALAYIGHWLDKRGYVQPLGADHPIPIHEIFVQVCAVPASFIRRFSSIEEMEADARAARTRGFNLSSRETLEYVPESGLHIANTYRRLNILGAPGAGKSTFLRRLGFEALLPKPQLSDTRAYSTEYTHNVIPVLIELR